MVGVLLVEEGEARVALLARTDLVNEELGLGRLGDERRGPVDDASDFGGREDESVGLGRRGGFGGWCDGDYGASCTVGGCRELQGCHGEASRGEDEEQEAREDVARIPLRLYQPSLALTATDDVPVVFQAVMDPICQSSSPNTSNSTSPSSTSCPYSGDRLISSFSLSLSRTQGLW
jgi:hypothetical protein